MRNAFLEKSYTQLLGETISRPFFKKSKLSISLDQYSKLIYFVFIACQVEDYRNWLKLSCRSLAFTSYKGFLKNKKRFGTSFPASFSAWSLKQKYDQILPDQILMSGCLCFVRYMYYNMCIIILCLPGWDVMNFEINLILKLTLFWN